MDNAVRPVITIVHGVPLSIKLISPIFKYTIDLGSGLVKSLIQRPYTTRYEDLHECG